MYPDNIIKSWFNATVFAPLGCVSITEVIALPCSYCIYVCMYDYNLWDVTDVVYDMIKDALLKAVLFRGS